MNHITVTCTKQQIAAMKARYSFAKQRPTPPYAYWQIALSDCVITAYESGKVVFQGSEAAFYAAGYESVSPIKATASISAQYPQWGSDEVGTGDYFGPVCVCAAAVDEADSIWLKAHAIQDSKAMKDETIRAIGKTLQERIPHSLLILDNATYNRVHQTDNMVAIKCKMHNQAFVHLTRRQSNAPKQIIVDQFVKEASYYRYLAHEAQVVRNIHFETKAENRYIAVACASVIARYAFLIAFDAMCEHYHFSFCKGASARVDQNIRDFLKRYPQSELTKVAKLHFANTKKAGIV